MGVRGNTHITVMSEEKIQKQREWAKHHYGTLARWIKEVALGVLASLVIQKLFAGVSFADPSVWLGIVVSFTLYVCAFHFLLKS